MTDQENPLEQALRLACTTPAHRPEFFKALLQATVFVIGNSSGSSESRTLEPGEKLAIHHWQKSDGTSIIPFFSSLEALSRGAKSEAGYISLPARSLFELTRQATLVLNPGSDHGKEFSPYEIESLLNEGVNRTVESRIIQKETQVLLGQPAHYPTEMVKALRHFFSRIETVQAAYLAQMHNPSESEKPHLVIGISAKGDTERLIRETGVVIGDTAPAGEPFDITLLSEKSDGLSGYFRREVKPFYKRTWGSKLKAFLGSN